MNSVKINLNLGRRRCWTVAAEDHDSWACMTEAEVDECLNVLPPIYFSGGFAVSEPIRDDLATGNPVFLAVVVIKGQGYCRQLARGDMASEARRLRDLF